MKKVFLMALAMVFTLSAYALDVNKKVNVSSFNGLDISSFFDVTVIKGGKEKVNIVIDEELEPYLVAQVYGNVLKLGLDSQRMPERLRRNMGNRTLTAEVTMSSLRKLEMSGASKLTSDDKFTIREFEGELSGASKVRSLILEAVEADFDISGASDADMELKVSEKADFDISGASEVNITADIRHLEIEASGAANVRVSGTYGIINADCSGASHCTLKGKTDKGKYGASGASKVDAEDLTANNVSVDASGASAIYAVAQEYIAIELSGASSLRYSGPESLKVDIREVSRGCSIKRR